MEFLSLLKERYANEFQLNSNVVVKPTKYKGGGLGVFYKHTTDLLALETIELMRIKRKFVINLPEFQEHGQHFPLFSTAMNELMSDPTFDFVSKYASEKNILMFCLTIFLSQVKDPDSDAFLIEDTERVDLKLAKEYADFVQKYISLVLMETSISTPLLYSKENLKWYKTLYPFLAVALEQQQSFLQELHVFFESKLHINVALSDLYQLYSAIGSRSLQIPEEISSVTQDFQVSETLVPVLDFVNHDNFKKNAYFDIDRSTNDIVLFLDVPAVADKLASFEEFEVYISYDPEEHLNKFDFTYGFVPPFSLIANSESQYLDIAIDFDLFPAEYRNISKWFQASPLLKFKLLPNKEVQVIDDEEEGKVGSLTIFTILSGAEDYKFVLNSDCPFQLEQLANENNIPNPAMFAQSVMDAMETTESEDYENTEIIAPQLRYFFQYKETPKINLSNLHEIASRLGVTKHSKVEWIDSYLKPYCVERCKFLKSRLDIPLVSAEYYFLKRVITNFNSDNLRTSQDKKLTENQFLDLLSTLQEQNTPKSLFLAWYERFL